MSWPVKFLGDLVAIKGGGTPARNVPEYWNGDIPWVSVKDFKSNLICEAEEYITEKGVENSATNVFPAGTIIIPTRMALGKVAIAGTKLAINQDLKALEIGDIKKLNRDYLVWFLRSQAHAFDKAGKGATVKGITVDFLKSVEIPLPPLETQKHIARVLEQADALRKHAQQMETELNQLAQSLFLEMFGDPVTNPKKWNFGQVSNLVREPLQNGAYYEQELYSESGIEMAHMSDTFYGEITRGKIKRVLASQSDIEKYALTTDDILVTRRSLVYEGAAKPCLIPKSKEPLIYESSMIRISPDLSKVRPAYLHHYLNNDQARKAYLFPYITRSTISGINQTNLAKVKIMLPSIESQIRFEWLIEKIKEEKNKLLIYTESLENLFSALMQRAFKGELTTKAA